MVTPLAMLGAAQVTVIEATPGVIALMVGDPRAPAQNGRPSWLRSLLATLAMPAGTHPVNWVPAEKQFLQVGEAAHFCRYRTGQLVL